jgi:nicotinate-nucleotide pyrophosphorylase (carboxylating)
MTDLNQLSLEALYAELTRTGLVRRLLQLAFEEDLGPDRGPGDITSRVCVPEDATCEGRLVARRAGTVAGIRAVPMVLQVFAPDVAFEGRAADGHAVEAETTLGHLRGTTRQVLAAERTLLNIVGRLSGIATLTASFVDKVKGSRAAVYDTRKTTPGLRMLEKYAVRCGGGRCHRLGLSDAVLIKDNHLAGIPLADLARFVSGAAARARTLGSDRAPHSPLRFVEVEVTSLEQLQAILGADGCNVDIVLLDNMDTGTLARAVEMRDRSRMKIELEASGGVSLKTIGAIAATGVERISVGALTHSAVALDVALDLTAA